jgi:hypothetical protein
MTPWPSVPADSEIRFLLYQLAQIRIQLTPRTSSWRRSFGHGVCYARPMSVRSCRVTVRDTEGIEHTAEVSAESVYEAVALGLRAIRQCSWVEEIGQNFTIRVLARDTRQFQAFLKLAGISNRAGSKGMVFG